jgi:hypothetical protein
MTSLGRLRGEEVPAHGRVTLSAGRYGRDDDETKNQGNQQRPNLRATLEHGVLLTGLMNAFLARTPPVQRIEGETGAKIQSWRFKRCIVELLSCPESFNM